MEAAVNRPLRLQRSNRHQDQFHLLLRPHPWDRLRWACPSKSSRQARQWARTISSCPLHSRTATRGSRHSPSSRLRWAAGQRSRFQRIPWQLCDAHPVHSPKATSGCKNMCKRSNETQSRQRIRSDKSLHRVRSFSSRRHRNRRNFKGSKAR